MTLRGQSIAFDSFDELEQFLLNWRSFSDPQMYDPAGMMTLLCACLTNLRANMVEGEIQDLGSGLTDEERTFLHALAPTNEN